MLAAKSWSPIQYLTRMSHEELNPYHRILGRILITFFSIHASMYMNFYVQKGLLLKRMSDRDVILGLTAIATFLLIGITALAIVRKQNYRLFFYLHVIFSFSVLPLLYFHVSHLRLYVIESALIYLFVILQRNVSQVTAEATICMIPSSNLLSISIPVTKPLSSKCYAPGQHIYLGLPFLTQKLRINPFSIANRSPTEDRVITLVARTLFGTTAMLADLAKQKTKPLALTLEGPYGAAFYFPDLAIYDSVLLVAGGVGATFTLPLYLDLLQKDKRGEQVPAMKFIWIVRKSVDANWGIEQMQNQYGSMPDGFRLYITQKDADELEGSDVGVKARPSAANLSDNIELQERDRLLSGTPLLEDIVGQAPKVTARGRPNLRTLVDDVFSCNGSGRVAVLICGPSGMGASMRKEVGRWVLNGRDVFWHSEEFGW